MGDYIKFWAAKAVFDLIVAAIILVPFVIWYICISIAANKRVRELEKEDSSHAQR